MKKTIGFLLMGLAILTAVGSAGTLTVDDDGTQMYTSIQDAINDAGTGDSVFVYPGTYHESIIMKDRVNVTGSGPEATIIDAQSLHAHVVYFSGLHGSLLSGFTIKGSASGAGQPNGWNYGGVYCEEGPLTIMNNVITENHAGIAAHYQGRPTIINNTIVDNLNGILVGPPPNVPSDIDVVFIYNKDLAAAQSFEDLLEKQGYDTDLLFVGYVANANFSPYEVIVIGSDTGYLQEWGDPGAVSQIVKSGLPVLGIGEGGYAFFGKLNLEIGYSHCGHDNGADLLVTAPNDPIFAYPYPITIPHNNTIDLYGRTSPCIVRYRKGLPNTVRVFGQDTSLLPRDFSSLLCEDRQYLLWGYDDPPDDMTKTGQQLFINAVAYLNTYANLPESSQLIMNNIVANNTQWGIGYYLNPLDGQILYNNVWENAARNYHNNNILFVPVGQDTFAPEPATGEISADPIFADVYFHLDEASPSVDAGHPGLEYNDPDDSRNDQGAYGGQGASGLGDFIGSGFIFTSVGNIPTSEIVQNQSHPSHGLALVDPCVAGMLSIPAYLDAPFGASLRIHGLFGSDDIAAGVKYYQILQARWETDDPPEDDDFSLLQSALYKVKYLPQPDGTVIYQYTHLGAKEVKGVPYCYELTHEGWWSHIDLRVIWNTRSHPDGKYTLKCQAYVDTPGGLIPYDPAYNELEELTLIINNTPVEAVIHSVKYDPCNVNYDPCSDGEIPECGIIALGSDDENLRFTITAYHPDGYLRTFILDALWGKNHNAGVIASDTYPGVVPPNNWPGVVNEEFHSADAPSLAPWVSCAYQFRLRAWSRITNGYGYLNHYPYRNDFFDHYTITFDLSPCGRADVDGSGFIDLGDIAELSAHWLTSCSSP